MEFIRNITSKNLELSKRTIKELINSENLAQFQELCEKSSFIFPFIKERIINDFVKLINKENLETIFKFTKVYSNDFEDLIIFSWLKFASEELTDEILDLFEKGDDNQKAYCAKYFENIQDSLCIEFLEKNLNSDFAPLRLNCILALKKFHKTNMLEAMINVVKNSNDDFEKNVAFEFLCVWGGKEQIEIITDYCFKSPFVSNIISDLLDYNSFDVLKEFINTEKIIKIFNVLIENYPENILLDTIQYYEIQKFIKFLSSLDTQYATNALLIAKAKFKEFSSNDIYFYDLSKDLINELKNIDKLLQNLNLDIDEAIELNTYKEDKNRFLLALNVILEYKIQDYNNILIDLANNEDLDYEILTKIIEILSKFSQVDLIKREKIEEIENPNIKALLFSYLQITSNY